MVTDFHHSLFLFHVDNCGTLEFLILYYHVNVFSGALPRPQGVRNTDHHACISLLRHLLWNYHPADVED